MAVVSISEYRELPISNGRPLHIAGRPHAKAAFVPAASSAPSQTFSLETRFIRVATDAAIYINHNCDGAAATTADDVMPANSVEFFEVRPSTFVAFRTL